MKLTHEQKEEVAHFFDQSKMANCCSSCGSRHLEIADRIFEIRDFKFGGLAVGGQVLPVLPITCRRCGAMTLFNALVIRLGIRDSADRS